MEMTFRQARTLLKKGLLSDDNAFEVLGALGRETSFGNRDAARDAIFWALGQRTAIPGGLSPLMESLLREHGLFPYVQDVLDMPLGDRLAYAAHRPDADMGRDLVFHAEQAKVYEHLRAGENVVLSAPTSFGKSLIIDAYLAEKSFTNAVIIVPTLALMDECRRRLTRLPGDFKVITHGSQKLGERNLFVMTQERFIELDALPQIEFFVVDEFYKLDPSHGDVERSAVLNIALDTLLGTGAQFYLLGPSVASISKLAEARLDTTFVHHTDFTTVATDVRRIETEDLTEAVPEICQELDGGTLIFCRSPKRTREVAEWLLARGVGGGHNLETAADWIGEAFHEEWTLAKALRQGIGIHHGKLPRALGHHMVRLFEEGRLPYLIVTSTLIEGVNTSARNIVIVDPTVSTSKYDRFTFNNISGRSGRMSKHFVGRVIVFNEPPADDGTAVDIPALSQSTRLDDAVLLQLSESSLSDGALERLREIERTSAVSLSTLRRNKGVPVAKQMEVGAALRDNRQRWQPALSWRTGVPGVEEVKRMGDVLVQLTGTGNVVRSGKQLSARINMLRHQGGDVAALARQEMERNGKSADEAIEDTLDFARNWMQFKIPRALMTATSLGQDVWGPATKVSNPLAFVAQLENMFMPPFVVMLEEYGLPTSTTMKIKDQLGLDSAESLDEVLDRLREVRQVPRTMGPFEREMIVDTIRTI
ncbi:DEAD/DEAH box helicase [Microbacterium oxydans]|uniref:Ski2-like helicase n=1 Tax=Microbacterium oxydans TaxID=82380 RepID=A0A0F0L567_9MICO|nr:DEAD/DEAH box helicase [Microbacterium oxydans]KJL28312.1 ski2-like helicase [Microbacterium oxydans]